MSDSEEIKSSLLSSLENSQKTSNNLYINNTDEDKNYMCLDNLHLERIIDVVDCIRMKAEDYIQRLVSFGNLIIEIL